MNNSMPSPFAAKITGIGSAFPKNRVTNEDIVKKLEASGIETSDRWIRERTGIRERRIGDMSNPAEHNSSLGLAAARKALDMAGKTEKDIDQILYATCTPDTLVPSTACWLQHKLGASQAWGMDLNAACSGFIYAVATAKQFIETGYLKTSLVVGADTLGPFTNWEDRGSCILFADGAGAVVIEQEPPGSTHRILTCHMLSNGDHWELLYIPAGGSSMEVTPGVYSKNMHKLRMYGKEIFKVAVRTLAEFAQRALAENQLDISELDWFVPHQANLRIIEAVAKRLKFPMEKVLINVDRYGNTSSATIPTALDEAVLDGRVKKGHTVLLDAFGAGLTYGAILLRW